MKLAIAVLVGSTAIARADAFDFKDVAGFERCMTLDHVVETVTTPTGAQTRYLDPSEIQPRCIESAVKLLAGAKPDEIVRFVEVVKRTSAAENALQLGRVAADHDPAACNAIEIYEVLIAGLAHDDEPYLGRAAGLARRCLDDSRFRNDFADERNNGDRHVAAHACAALLDKKLVTSCPRSKP